MFRLTPKADDIETPLPFPKRLEGETDEHYQRRWEDIQQTVREAEERHRRGEVAPAVRRWLNAKRRAAQGDASSQESSDPT